MLTQNDRDRAETRLYGWLRTRHCMARGIYADWSELDFWTTVDDIAGEFMESVDSPLPATTVADIIADYLTAEPQS